MSKRWLLPAVIALAVAVPSLSSADPAPVNLARGAVASVSSAENSGLAGDKAIDGDLTTRWSSGFSDPQTLELDLGARASIGEIKLSWEAAYGKAYTLEVSNDRATWTPVASTANSDGGTDDYPGLTATGRYVRLTGTQRATQYGYSLYEIEVDGEFLDTAVSAAASSYSLPEKDGQITVPVRLNRASGTEVTVKYATADVTAESGKDYEAASGTLTFPPGTTEQTVTLKSIDDQVDEPTETFDLNLSDATAGVGIAPRAKATVSIADDDETAFSGKTLTVADFEGDLHVLTAPNPDQSGLFTFAGSDPERPALSGDPTVRPGSAGTQSMKVVSNVNSYGGFSNNLSAPQDWSAYDGFSFWLKGTNTGHTLQFEIKDGGNDGEHSELFESHLVDDSTAWKLVRVPFTKFTKRTDYQPGGNPTDGKLDLTKMWGFAMNLGTGANAFLIDDVQVYQQVLTVEDFEGARTLGERGFSAFNGGGGPPALAIESQPRDGVTDNHALKVDYDVPSGGYGGFVQDLADPQDWSAFKGIRFWYYGRPRSSAAPGRVYFETKDGGTGPGASELWNTSFLDDTLGWHLVEIPFNKLQYRGDYQPVGGIDHILNLTKMWGYALTVPPGDKGSFDFDDVQVYGVAGAPPDVSAATDKNVYLGNEGDTVDVGVKLTTLDGQPTKDAVAVGYATGGGTATAGDDYESASGTLSFDAGTASGTVKTFPVKLLTDAAAEVAERIDVTLTSADAGVPETPSAVVINANGLPYLNPALPADARIADLLGRMTLAEKVGQMTQAERQALKAPGDIATYALGSLLSGGGSTPPNNTPAGWADMVDGFQTQALASRLQIPLIYGVDAVHGHNNVLGATLFPHNIGLGAAHDPALVEQAGAVTADETKSTGVPWAFAPCLCVARDERWGRTYESFGEDPALVIRDETVINGLQDNGVLATAKHFAGDGGTTFGSSTTGSYTIDQGVTPPADMETLHLPPFAEAVRRGVGSVMPSYSSDGPTKMHADGALINGWLKGRQGFNGFVVSDWQAIDAIPGDYNSDVRTSINAGLDMIMVPYEYQAFESALTAEVAAGRVPMSRVDDAVTRILREKLRLGLFEHPFADRAHQGDFGSAAHRAVARRAAAESQVLLKNAGGVLPLSKTAKVYVAGSNADDVGNQAGGWTVTWQGGSGNTDPGVTTIRAGMRAVAPGATIDYSKDASAPTGGYDVGVVVVGETPYAEGVGDVGNGRADLSLSAADRTAIDRVCGAMKCAVLVVSGRPMLISDRLGSIGALVASWLPGSEGAGVADVLFGDKPFTGRLPATWAKSMAQLPINVGDATYDPEFPFGWGLRTDSAKARLQRARDLGATSLDAVLAADDWNADGSVKHGADVLIRLGTVAQELDRTTGESWEVDDLVVSVARDLAQAAMVRKGINAETAALSADAEHALYAGDVGAAISRLTRVALTSIDEDGGPTGEVPPTLALSLGASAPLGTFVPGLAKDYTASVAANVISTAGNAALTVVDPSSNAPGHLVNGAYSLPSALQAHGDGPFADISGTPLLLRSWAGPVSNDALTVWFQQHIGANDGLRTGSYGKTLVFTLSTTLP
jgi:beta-glucosidase